MLNQQKPLYFPLSEGRYEVKPGLFRFPHDFGNQGLDNDIFQLDADFSEFRAVKLAARAEHLDKYYCSDNFTPSTMQAITSFTCQRLAQEHPLIFQLEQKGKQHLLHCRHSGESLIFDKAFSLQGVENQQSVSPCYQDGLDALACQLQEDIAVINIGGLNGEQVTALHLCFPNYWAAADKIGQGFIAAHAPVPGMDKINSTIKPLLDALLNKGPFVRFAWGLTTDTRLNHHPQPRAGVAEHLWQGRRFDMANPELYLRIERQTLHGFPDQRSVLFTIRTYFMAITALETGPDKIRALTLALESMPLKSLHYKGLRQDHQAILQWLTAQL